MKVVLTILFSGLLFTVGCQSNTIAPSKEIFDNIEGVTTKVTPLQGSVGFRMISYYRGDTKILEKVQPPNKEHWNTTFRIYLDNRRIFTFKSGPVGTEFRSSDRTRKYSKTQYTIKMAGDRNAKINRIMIYTDDSKRTLDGFWLRNNQVIPLSETELENLKELRGEGSNKSLLPVADSRHWRRLDKETQE